MSTKDDFINELLLAGASQKRETIVLKLSVPVKTMLVTLARRTKKRTSYVAEKIFESFFDQLDDNTKSKLLD
jgi:hypothetical protein